jgi:GDP-L-fucose synthase
MSPSVLRVFIAGHRGMVGSALIRQLGIQKNVSIITASRAELDLTNQQAVNEFFAAHKIDQVYLAAAKVGGFTLMTRIQRISSIRI